jgi:threonylcarbamoyladenosine tRNA methylthiotransferase MtaB
MVGFPGETDAEFRESLLFAETLGFAKAHVFAYSPRPGTVAAAMPGQIPREVKSTRAKEMAEAMNRRRRDFLLAQVGRAASVLFERQIFPALWEGYSENYTPIVTESAADLAGRILPVTIMTVDGDGCVGSINGVL